VVRGGVVIAALAICATSAFANNVTGGASGGKAFDPDEALKFSQSVIGKPIGDYAFLDRKGKTVRLADYRGKPLVVSFVYTGCFQVCPAATQFLKLADEKARVRLVSQFDWENTIPEQALAFRFDIVLRGHEVTPMERLIGE